ncbi:MAG: bifunctional methylenetetrahydrofolate dehydrogenase/methenyltetrahydrofolate cyclohydrolase [Leifsonia xyli]|nr:MAG: bifunctional methylenetetrahydrofolate dehydrogenase/methenyltetrahydrofolate cyclohydrolase [Leifsonia xyli]
MTAKIIDGAAEAKRLVADVEVRAASFAAAHGRKPGLAVVLVGANPASAVYVRAKTAKAVEAGLTSFQHDLPSSCTEADLMRLIDRLNGDPLVDGILVQLPLPGQIPVDRVLRAVDPAKDVDGFHPMNAGLLATGQPGVVACTPLGCLRLIHTVHRDLTGLDVVVVGRSNIVGRPAAQLLLAQGASVDVVHKDSRDVPGHCRRADILVVAAGSPRLVRKDWVKPGAVVIDVGINRVAENGATRLIGDVDFDAVRAVAAAITPVPGGVGPMTVAALMENTLLCAESRAPARLAAAV